MQKIIALVALGALMAAPSFAWAASNRHDPSEALVVASVGLDFGGRRFAYSDALTPNLRDYQLFGAPMPKLGVTLYPLAWKPWAFVRDLGVGFRYAQALGLDSETGDGTVVGTTWERGLLFLKARLRPVRNKRTMIGLSLGLGFDRFVFRSSSELSEEVPSVAYLMLRPGVDTRLPVGKRVSVLLDLGYLGVISSGAVGERMRGAQTGGVDLGLGLGFKLGWGMELQANMQYTRYFHAFSPEPGDTYVAGGALDEMLTLGLRAVYAY